MAVSPEYFDVLDIDVVKGRGFTQAERTAEAAVLVVSEAVARRIWPNRAAVRQVVRLRALHSGAQGDPSLSSADQPPLKLRRSAEAFAKAEARRQHRPGPRSRGVRRERAGHHHIVRAGRVGSRLAPPAWIRSRRSERTNSTFRIAIAERPIARGLLIFHIDSTAPAF
jgi:hypothetical protein